MTCVTFGITVRENRWRALRWHQSESPQSETPRARARDDDARTRADSLAHGARENGPARTARAHTPPTPLPPLLPQSFGAATGASAKPKVVRNEDGSFRCQRKGCTAKSARDDEGPRACVHHVGTPIFHETYKWWSCCPHAKKYDFDEFMQVTGCRVGAHWSGEGDEPPTEPYT